MADAELDRLVIDIDAIDRNAIVSLDKLGDALTRMKDSLSSLNSTSFVDIVYGLAELNEALRAMDTKAVNKLAKAGDVLTDFVNKVSNINFNALNQLNLDGASEAFRKLAEPIEAVAKPLEVMNEMLIKVDDELQNKPKDVHKAVKAIEKLKGTTKQTQGHLSKFADTLKRMVILRAIRGGINALIQGMKEGLSNAYQFSKLVGHDIAGALDRMASAGLKMKNQMGSAFGEVLRAIEPVVIRIFALITQVADYIARIMAIFNGSDTYLQAQDVETYWEDSAKGVKEYKRQLLGLDELNVLSNQKSGSGSPAVDVSKMFKEVAVDSNISKGTFEKLKLAADSLKKAVSAVVSLVKSEGFQKIVGLIGDILSSAFVGSLKAFGDFCEIVEGLLNGDWNKFWSGFDKLGEDVANAIDEIGSSIADFFGVDWNDFKIKLGVWVGDLQDGLADFFDGVIDSLKKVLLVIFDNSAMKAIFNMIGVDIEEWLISIGAKNVVKQEIPDGWKNRTGDRYGRYTGAKVDVTNQQSSEWYTNYYGSKVGGSTGTSTEVKIGINSEGFLEAIAKKQSDETLKGIWKAFGGQG